MTGNGPIQSDSNAGNSQERPLYALSDVFTVVSTISGEPTITGAAQVGRTLGVDTADIMDTDGLTSPGFTYEWFRVDQDGTNPVSIGTAATYTFVAADLAKRIEVLVNFTNDANNIGGLTTASTIVVPDAVENCSPAEGNIWCTTVTVGYGPSAPAPDFILGHAINFGTNNDTFGTLDVSTFSHLGVDYTVSGVIAPENNTELYLATTPELPADGGGLTVHLQQITGDELELPLGDATLTSTALFDENVWNFGTVLAKTGDNPHIPLLRGFSSGNAP